MAGQRTHLLSTGMFHPDIHRLSKLATCSMSDMPRIACTICASRSTPLPLSLAALARRFSFSLPGPPPRAGYRLLYGSSSSGAVDASPPCAPCRARDVVEAKSEPEPPYRLLKPGMSL